MMKKINFLLAVLFLSVMFCGVSLQASQDQMNNVKKGQVVLKPLEKLGRGIANVSFGVLEFPIQIHEITVDGGGIKGLCYGPLQGLAFFLARIGVGLIDIVTFPFPLPNCPETPEGYGSGYGPIMYPAWVVDVEHDWWNFVYDRNTIPTRTY